ncbi:tuberoinfundibular peptide of 39 residues [Aulostomus maculatus]
MTPLPALPRTAFLLLCILGITMVTSGFPQPLSPCPSESESFLSASRRPDNKPDSWGVVFPSFSLHDWSLHMMSAPSLGAAPNRKAGLMREAWLFAPGREDASVERAWPAEWSSQDGGLVKRNMVVADDAAFREKSKLLTSMERQKWLNSYMQKLLVVKSSR